LEVEMKSKSIFFLLTIFLSSALAHVACGQRKHEWKGTITEKDGVVIVQNPKEPLYRTARFTVVQDLRIGQPVGKPEYMLSEIRDITADAKSNIYAVEFKEKHIRVFDKNGVFVRTIGRPGQGPGEFGEPGNVHVNQAGEIMATDGGSQSVKVFSHDGKYLRQYLLKTFYPLKLGYGSGDVFYGMTFSMEPPGFRLFRLDSRTEESSSLAVWKMPPPDPKRASAFDPIMSFAVMPDDRLLYGCPTEEYELQMFSPNGRLERRILRDWNPQPVTEKEKEAVLNLLKNRLPAGQGQMEFPKFHAPYRVVTCDDLGHIIVYVHSEFTAEASEKTDALFDVFDKEGRYIAQLSFPFKTVIEAPLWKGGKLYTVEQDKDGYLYIVRYAVEFNF
jgi:hypothetical protein